MGSYVIYHSTSTYLFLLTNQLFLLLHLLLNLLLLLFKGWNAKCVFLPDAGDAPGAEAVYPGFYAPRQSVETGVWKRGKSSVVRRIRTENGLLYHL